MRRTFWVLILGLFISEIAHADIYVKMAGMNGIGVHETWYSDKKKREVVHVDLGSVKDNKITITRVDKNIKWELDPDLHMYRETPIALPDTPGDKIPEEAKANPDEKWVDLPKEEKDYCDPELVTLPEKQTLAGFEATGYQAVCKQRDDAGMPRMTMWLSPAKGVLAQYDKELKAYEKAFRNVQFKKMTPAERKFTEEFYESFGEAAGSMLLGLRIDKIPKGVTLKMEQDGERPDGKPGKMVMVEVLEVRAEAADPALFELPAGYTKITNEEEYYNMQMQQKADQMGMGQIFRDQMASNKTYKAALEAEQRTKDQASAVEEQAPIPVQQAQPAPSQNEQSTDDFDARDYAH